MVNLHKPGEQVEVYSDPEVNVGPLAKVELISFIRTGLPFVIEDNKVSKDLNKVYNLEFWLATVVESKNKHFPVGYATIFPIRVFNTVGQTTEYSNEPSQVKVIKELKLKILMLLRKCFLSKFRRKLKNHKNQIKT